MDRTSASLVTTTPAAATAISCGIGSPIAKTVSTAIDTTVGEIASAVDTAITIFAQSLAVGNVAKTVRYPQLGVNGK